MLTPPSPPQFSFPLSSTLLTLRCAQEIGGRGSTIVDLEKIRARERKATALQQQQQQRGGGEGGGEEEKRSVKKGEKYQMGSLCSCSKEP